MKRRVCRCRFVAWALPALTLMGMAAPVAAAAWLPEQVTRTGDAAPLPADTTDPYEALPFQLSLPTEADQAAWQQPGFRLELATGLGALRGLGGAPGSKNIPILLRFGARLPGAWSLLASFQFAVAGWRSVGDLSGLRFAGTIDPTLHITDHLALAVGFGFGGIVEGVSGRAVPDAGQRSALVASYTFPDARTPLSACNGVGAAGLVRASYLWVLGPLSATGFAAQFDGQWTACSETVGQVEPDTARPIVRRQWWGDWGGSLTWVISWR